MQVNARWLKSYPRHCQGGAGCGALAGSGISQQSQTIYIACNETISRKGFRFYSSEDRVHKEDQNTSCVFQNCSLETAVAGFITICILQIQVIALIFQIDLCLDTFHFGLFLVCKITVICTLLQRVGDRLYLALGGGRVIMGSDLLRSAHNFSLKKIASEWLVCQPAKEWSLGKSAKYFCLMCTAALVPLAERESMGGNVCKTEFKNLQVQCSHCSVRIREEGHQAGEDKRLLDAAITFPVPFPFLCPSVGRISP